MADENMVQQDSTTKAVSKKTKAKKAVAKKTKSKKAVVKKARAKKTTAKKTTDKESRSNTPVETSVTEKVVTPGEKKSNLESTKNNSTEVHDQDSPNTSNTRIIWIALAVVALIVVAMLIS